MVSQKSLRIGHINTLLVAASLLGGVSSGNSHSSALKANLLPAASQMQWLSHLSVQCDGTWLALGADATGPRKVPLTPGFDLAANVLQGDEFPPDKEDTTV